MFDAVGSSPVLFLSPTPPLPHSPTHTHNSIISLAGRSVDALRQPEVITEFTRVLRTNERVCLTVGASFAKQMGHLYADLLNCYAAFSSFISST